MTSLSSQLDCAKRELDLRRRVYPKWVQEGRISQAAANRGLEDMQSIVLTLEKMKALEEISEEMKQNAPFE